jgi:tripartite-type tricarboxylate transporter receptor subunit TctC
MGQADHSMRKRAIPPRTPSEFHFGLFSFVSFVVRLFFTGLAFASAAPIAVAQGWPAKPVRIILPFAGGTDVAARILAVRLAPLIGQQVVPEPRLGAGGNIAHEAVAKAPPDGYTLLMGAPPVVINPHLNPRVGFDPLRDFTPIVLLGTIPNAIVVHPAVPAKSLKELVQLARANPGKLTYGSGGVGSSNHLSGELLKSLTKTNIVHVPYKSATIGLVGASSGEVDIVVVVVSSIAPYVQQGRMRALAVLDTKRVPALPQVPTSAEAGYPDLITVNWYLLLGPAGTPRAVVERLNAESVKAMTAPDTRERFAALGGEPASSTPDQAAEFLRAEHVRWGRVIRDAGIKAE